MVAVQGVQAEVSAKKMRKSEKTIEKNKITLFNSDKQDKISSFALKWYLHIFNSKSNI